MIRAGLCNITKFRSRAFAKLITGACCLLVAAGCAATTKLSDEELLLPLSGQAATLIDPGSFDYTLVSGEHRGEFGCTLDYETYRPTPGADDTMVLLAHGFLRNLETMRGWAEHWASHGVAVTVMSLCNSSVFAGNHERNAADMIALAAALHTGQLIYAGFSAGGLAADLAAAADTRTVGYLGLDAVDHKALALTAAREFDYPALLLIAEPSVCNRKNNMLDVAVQVPGYRALRITNSTHCHFEYPYDSRCEIACGAVRPRESQDVLIDTVRSLATAWILELTSDGVRPEAEDVLSTARTGPWQGRVELVR